MVEAVVVVGSRILQVAAALLHEVGELGIEVINLLLYLPNQIPGLA